MNNTHEEHAHMAENVKPASYTPLILVISGVVAATVIWQWGAGEFGVRESMRLFMGFFFLVFGFFKALDLRGFASAYAEYDLLAKRSRGYALSYPAIELTLGVAYVAGFELIITNVITFVIMSISVAGVIMALRSKTAIRCACLGVVVKLPMTTVTVVEDVGMGVMAAIMFLVDIHTI